MHKSYKKTIAILITCALISALLCLPVSAVSSVTIGDFTFSNPSFRTYVNDYGYQEPTEEDNLWVEYFELTDGVLQWVLDKDEGENFGGGSDKYRCMEGKITFPYSDYNRVFTFIVTPTFSWNGDTYHESNFDLSLGSHTYFYSNGNKLDYTAERLDSNNSVVFTVNVKNYDSIDFQVSSLCYIGWEAYSLIFSHFQLDANPNKDIIDNQNQNAADIQANQDKNTQSIIDNQNELAEQEKQEITDSGNQATDAMDSIPNESEGFINALGTFVSTMSTTDTACSITFPAIKTPSFAGIPAATLSEEKEVDFSTAISLIPSDIMKLIQALTTIALIVFCFKELYDTISEALTRKKANSDG